MRGPLFQAKFAHDTELAGNSFSLLDREDAVDRGKRKLLDRASGPMNLGHMHRNRVAGAEMHTPWDDM
jgi:hypothetical protein